jgi:tetratricopeptide (TPR) repeat protein
MKTATLIKFAVSSLTVGTVITGCAQGHMPLASASQPASFVKAANKFAAKATKAMAKGKFGQAVDLAERAVAGAPDNASYRATLGQAYLNVGRFTSAEDALEDALSLDQGNGRIALNLALAQIANGKTDTAMPRLPPLITAWRLRLLVIQRARSQFSKLPRAMAVLTPSFAKIWRWLMRLLANGQMRA